MEPRAAPSDRIAFSSGASNEVELALLAGSPAGEHFEVSVTAVIPGS